MPANDAGGTLAVPAPTAAKRPGRIVYARYLKAGPLSPSTFSPPMPSRAQGSARGEGACFPSCQTPLRVISLRFRNLR